MTLDRREFLLGAAALASPALPDLRGAIAATSTRVADGSPVFPPAIRADFPIASSQTYLNSAAIHPMSLPCVARADGSHRVPPQGRRRRARGLRRRPAEGPEEALRPADQRERRTRSPSPPDTSDGENIVVMGLDLPKKRRQHRHRRAALHDVALHVQGAREAGRRAAHRQAPQLGDRSERHGQGDRPQHAARVAGARVERQRLHARLQGRERPRARARRLRVRRHHPGRRARCRWT